MVSQLLREEAIELYERILAKKESRFPLYFWSGEEGLELAAVLVRYMLDKEDIHPTEVTKEIFTNTSYGLFYPCAMTHLTLSLTMLILVSINLGNWFRLPQVIGQLKGGVDGRLRQLDGWLKNAWDGVSEKYRRDLSMFTTCIRCFYKEVRPIGSPPSGGFCVTLIQLPLLTFI